MMNTILGRVDVMVLQIDAVLGAMSVVHEERQRYMNLHKTQLSSVIISMKAAGPARADFVIGVLAGYDLEMWSAVRYGRGGVNS